MGPARRESKLGCWKSTEVVEHVENPCRKDEEDVLGGEGDQVEGKVNEQTEKRKAVNSHIFGVLPG